MYKVLITTSGTGSRLGDITNYTNKSLVRVGKKPAISYIIEKYPEDIEFVITVGYKKELVIDFLNISYPNRKFTFVDVDKYEGDGSSLAYSISKAEKELQCPFIYQACDTIVFDTIDFNDNWCGVYSKEHVDNSIYSTVKINGKYIDRVNNKGDINFDYIYIGVSFIKDYFLFWLSMKEVLKDPKCDLSDWSAINKMIEFNIKFKYKVIEKWFDIGNTQSLSDTRYKIEDKFEILDKVDESIFLFDDFVVKFFNDKKIIKNRVERTKILGDVVPQILDQKDNFYKYEYVKGDLFSESINNKKFENFLDWLRINLWKENSNVNGFFDICKSFYFDKTNKRLEQLFKILNIEDCEDTINGIKIPTIKSLMEKIDVKWLCDVKPYNFHGDLILDNVISSNNGDDVDDEFKLLDWRQDFGGDIKRGDIYYDLAKLNHNFVLNHNLINKKNYIIDVDESGIKCDILRSNMLCECQEIFHKFIIDNNYDLKKVKLLSSIIWLNMSPLHDYPLNKFLYYFGKYNLYKNIMETT